MTEDGREDERAGASPPFLDVLLDRASSGAPAAEAFWRCCRRVCVSFCGGRPWRTAELVTEEVGLRVVAGGRLGFVCRASAGLDEEPAARAPRLVELALAAARVGPPAEFELALPAPPAPVNVFDPALTGLTARQAARLGKRIATALGGPANFAAATADIAVEVQDIAVALANSCGARAGYRKTAIVYRQEPLPRSGARGPRAVIAATAVKAALAAAAVHGGPWRDDPGRPGARRAWRPPEGRAAIVLAPPAVAVFARAIARSCRGTGPGAGVARGNGAGMRFDPAFRVCDDPAVDGALNSCPWDDEAVPARPVPLVSGGAVAGALHDLGSAARCRVPATGSARRAWLCPPAPQPSNVIVGAGDRPLAVLLGDVGDGLLVHDLDGSPAADGGFLLPVALADRVRGGQVAGRAARFALRGNLCHDFALLIGISREAAWVAGDALAPYIAVDGLEVVRLG